MIIKAGHFSDQPFITKTNLYKYTENFTTKTYKNF